MAGIVICGGICICCCCIAPAIIGSTYLLANYVDGKELLPAIIPSILFILKLFGYSLLFIALCYLLGYVFYKIHKTGLRMVELKHRNNYLYKSEDLKTNYREMLKVIGLNLSFIFIIYYFGGYLQKTYLNILIIFYISFIFGYVAVYPLSEKDTSSLLDSDRYRIVEKKIKKMTALNTCIFFLMFASIYYFYY
jgi:hypothetical protein